MGYNDLQISVVESIMNDMITGETFHHAQSVNYLIDRMGQLTSNLAFINNQMAIAKAVLNTAKVKTYQTFIASSIANREYLTASLAKDYINAKLAKEQYGYDLCERCSRALVHTIDSLRTAISALKMEKEYG